MRRPSQNFATLSRSNWIGSVAVFISQASLLQPLIDQPIFLRLVGRHEEIAIAVFGDAFNWLGGVLGIELVQRAFEAYDFFGLDHNVRGRALRAAPGLMDHDAGVGQRKTFAFGAG